MKRLAAKVAYVGWMVFLVGSAGVSLLMCWMLFNEAARDHLGPMSVYPYVEKAKWVFLGLTVGLMGAVWVEVRGLMRSRSGARGAC